MILNSTVRKNWRPFVKMVTPYLFVLPAIIVLMILMLYPIFKVIQYSFYDNFLINPNPQWIGLKNFFQMLKDQVFQVSLLNTIIFTLASVILHQIVGLVFAVLLNQPINKNALAFFRMVLILPWIFTATVVAVNWQLLLNPLGVVNYILKGLHLINTNIEWFGDAKWAMPGLILVNTWRGYPFIMISILAGLQSIPGVLYEAAKVDGANGLQTFLHITLPQLRPVILSIALLDTIWTFHLFPLIWLTTGGGPGHATEVVATYTYKIAFEQFQFGMGSAVAVMILLITMILTYFYLKQQKMNE